MIDDASVMSIEASVLVWTDVRSDSNPESGSWWSSLPSGTPNLTFAVVASQTLTVLVGTWVDSIIMMHSSGFFTVGVA